MKRAVFRTYLILWFMTQSIETDPRSLGPDCSSGPGQRSPQTKWCETQFHVSALNFYRWQGRGSTSGSRSGGARVGPGDQAGAKAQLKRKRRRREDSCWAQMNVAHQGLVLACHSWTRFQPLSRQGKCEALNINLYWRGHVLYPVVDPDCQVAPSCSVIMHWEFDGEGVNWENWN